MITESADAVGGADPAEAVHSELELCRAAGKNVVAKTRGCVAARLP